MDPEKATLAWHATKDTKHDTPKSDNEPTTPKSNTQPTTNIR